MLAPYFENGIHSLKGRNHVVDIRNYGFAGGLTLAALPGEPARRPFEVAMRCWERGVYVRYGGDTLQFGPPFVIEKGDLDRLFNVVADALDEQP